MDTVCSSSGAATPRPDRTINHASQNVRGGNAEQSAPYRRLRGELGRFLFTAENYDRAHAALAVLLGLNGLRVSEACATNIENLAVERGRRTLRIVGTGNKPTVIPLVLRTGAHD